MNKILLGALPTTNIDNKNSASKARLELFNHYINHKVNSKRTVMENIISSFNKKYKPERYFVRSHENSKITDDSLRDIRSVALMIVWEATDKYLFNSTSDTNILYKEKFDFCIFASKQLQFKLKTHLRHLNTNRICGKLPDSDVVRNIYSKLPKLKLNKKSLSDNDYKIIAKEINVKIDEVKLVDKFITSKTESGDEETKNEENENNNNRWSQLEIDRNINFENHKNLEDRINEKIIIKKFHIIKDKFLQTLPLREKEILKHTKLNEFNSCKELTLIQLGKKYNVSPERVRQISEKNFLQLKKIFIKNKKNLEIN